MKKFISLTLAVLLVLLSFQSAFAAPRIPVYKVGNVLYFFDKSSGTITGFAGEPKDLIIPTELNGHKVVSIGTGAFSSCPTLSTLSIPYGVCSISANAFSGCTNLMSVEIGATVSFIGDSAFRDCTSLSRVTFLGLLDNIESNAFYNTPWITNSTDEFVMLGGTTLIKYNGTSERVVVPAGVKKIEANAFSWNPSIKEVVLPYGLQKIGDNAFVHCYSLEKIEIPSTVAYIGTGAFDDTIWLNNQEGNFICVNGILIAYRGNDKSVIIPDGITGIGSGAFMSNESLMCVTVPESVLYIDTLAFSGCSNLICANISHSVEWIDEYAFSGCTKLSLCVTEGTYGENYAQSMEIIISRPVPAYYNWNQVIFDGVYPLLLNGTAYIPLRAVLEDLGYTVLWDNISKSTKCVKGDYYFIIEQSGRVLINSQIAWFTAEPINIKGKTLYPSNIVSLLTGNTIEWNEQSKSIMIY
ncbi:MAG: leucine-rich repeat protein [Clostridia bacterium]|nr:leucine-rich repeat protein [Clostridia bacterium]